MIVHDRIPLFLARPRSARRISSGSIRLAILLAGVALVEVLAATPARTQAAAEEPAQSVTGEIPDIEQNDAPSFSAQATTGETPPVGQTTASDPDEGVENGEEPPVESTGGSERAQWIRLLDLQNRLDDLRMRIDLLAEELDEFQLEYLRGVAP